MTLELAPAAAARAGRPEAAPLRILSVSNVYPNARDLGYGVFVRARLQHMAEAADVRVIAPIPLVDYGRLWRGGSGRIPARTLDGRVEVRHPRWFYPPGGGCWNALWLAVQLAGPVRRIRKEFEPDLIDAHFGYPTGVAAAILAKWLGKPFAVTLRGNETMHAESWAARWLMAWSLRRAALVIAVSERLHRFAVSMGAQRVVTIPNGVDTGVFRPMDRAECRGKLGIAEGELVVLSAGSLIERKGHHKVIAALAGLRRRGVPVRLLIAGGPGREGDYGGPIHAAVEQSGAAGAVTFMGHMEPEALAECMAAADVFCLASSREGWPNVVHEALSCGTPVVATDVGAVADLVPSAEFGMVVPALSESALAAALERALETKWDRGRIAAWGQSRSWVEVGREAVEALRGACNG